MAPHHDRHQHRTARSSRRLAWTLAISAAYMLAEAIGGWLANSLALLADAGHMLSDVAALGLSLFALWLARRPASAQRTYGYYRTEILAALVNGGALLAVSGFIFVEAYQRFLHPPEVQGGMMMTIAVGGLLVNLAGLAILGGAREESLNVHSAWLHVLADAIGSLGAILAGLLIWAFGWYWADPVTSVFVALLIIYSSWNLLSESVSVLMENAPRGINVDDVYRLLLEAPHVREVHDLHVWTITSGIVSLSAHVVVDDHRRDVECLAALRHLLHERFGIDHVTLQLEPEGFAERPAGVCNGACPPGPGSEPRV